MFDSGGEQRRRDWSDSIRFLSERDVDVSWGKGVNEGRGGRIGTANYKVNQIGEETSFSISLHVRVKHAKRVLNWWKQIMTAHIV